MKSNRYVLALSLLALLIIDCKSSKEPATSSTGVWVNREKLKDKSYNSVFIVMLTADIQARLLIENDLATVATKRGFKVVKSSDVLPTDLKNPKLPDKDSLIVKIEQSGCNAVFVGSLLKKEEQVQNIQGQTTYALQPYATYYPGYYSHLAPAVSEPGYVSHEKNYFMQSNLYDVASREVMWSVQSTIFSPDDLKGFSKSYTNTLMKQLEKAKVLKK